MRKKDEAIQKTDIISLITPAAFTEDLVSVFKANSNIQEAK